MHSTFKETKGQQIWKSVNLLRSLWIIITSEILNQFTPNNVLWNPWYLAWYPVNHLVPESKNKIVGNGNNRLLSLRLRSFWQFLGIGKGRKEEKWIEYNNFLRVFHIFHLFHLREWNSWKSRNSWSSCERWTLEFYSRIEWFLFHLNWNRWSLESYSSSWKVSKGTQP